MASWGTIYYAISLAEQDESYLLEILCFYNITLLGIGGVSVSDQAA